MIWATFFGTSHLLFFILPLVRSDLLFRVAKNKKGWLIHLLFPLSIRNVSSMCTFLQNQASFWRNVILNVEAGGVCKAFMIKDCKLSKTLLWFNQRCVYLPVVPGQAGGGSFEKEKNYIAKKEFAYRMCARRPTSEMPKSFLCSCSPSAVPWCWRDLFWCHEVACQARSSNVVGCQVTWWVLLLSWDVSCHDMSSTFYSSTTKYYSISTLYFKVLVPYYKESTTPVLQRTSLHYNVLLPCYKVLLPKHYSSTFL